MANYCLVRGGWHEGCAWKRVARHLKEEGQNVYTPTMTGLGEPSHLFNATINSTTADYCAEQGCTLDRCTKSSSDVSGRRFRQLKQTKPGSTGLTLVSLAPDSEEQKLVGKMIQKPSI
jgi:hypothetical protein